jgi:ribonuclease HI
MGTQRLLIFTDGGARGNPGPAAIGFVVKDERGKILAQKGKFLGRATNNVAEYQALIEALKWLIANNANGLIFTKEKKLIVNFFLDSQLVVNQLNGFYKIKDIKLKNLIIKVKSLEKKINGKIFYGFVHRQKNRQADFLVNQTLDNQGY